MSLIDLVARTATREELVKLLRGTEEQRQAEQETRERYQKALEWCRDVNACDYEYRKVASAALSSEPISQVIRHHTNMNNTWKIECDSNGTKSFKSDSQEDSQRLREDAQWLCDYINAHGA